MWTWNDGSDYLMHHGIKGQKWGIRRFQNPDGTLTEAGKVRYSKNLAKYENNINLYLYKGNKELFDAEDSITKLDMSDQKKFIDDAEKIRSKAYFNAYRYEWTDMYNNEIAYDKEMQKLAKKFGDQSVDEILSSKAFKDRTNEGADYFEKAKHYRESYISLKSFNDMRIKIAKEQLKNME